jgi:hypothetical protein
MDGRKEPVDSQGQRVTGLIRSQYPASGGCVLGIEHTARRRCVQVDDLGALAGRVAHRGAS